jgi:hypothetical protein
MTVQEAIRAAERILHQDPEPHAGPLDQRWQAIIAVSEFIVTEPDVVWEFIARWGRNNDKDLRNAIATLLLEHLLEHYFSQYFPKVIAAVEADSRFASTFARCWKFGQAELEENASLFDGLKKRAILLEGSR